MSCFLGSVCITRMCQVSVSADVRTCFLELETLETCQMGLCDQHTYITQQIKTYCKERHISIDFSGLSAGVLL